MRIALAQLDSRLGDVAVNARRASAALAEARAGGAELIVFPELQLSGYGADSAGADAALSATDAVAYAGGDTALVCFHEQDRGRHYNSAAYVEDSAPVHVHRKLYL